MMERTENPQKVCYTTCMYNVYLYTQNRKGFILFEYRSACGIRMRTDERTEKNITLETEFLFYFLESILS